MNKKPLVMLVFGTRPEAIKMAPVVSALKDLKEIDSQTCVTGQHRDMLDQVLNAFDIQPDHDLSIMKTGQDLTDVTSEILIKLRAIFKRCTPDLVVVHGDTATALATSLAAYYAQIPVAHVEAGLRTGNKYSPFPEEINRKVAGCIADIHFAPTAAARENLVKEGVDASKILITGNTVIDALLAAREKFISQHNSDPGHAFPFTKNGKHTILVTGHRRENFGDGINNICNALLRLSRRNDVNIVYPVHPNPNIQAPVTKLLGNQENIYLIPPQEYVPFVGLLEQCTLILTDSGGIQEEAPSLGKPVLVMRDTTERPEAVEAGTVILVGTNEDVIVSHATRLLTDSDYRASFLNKKNPYGDGSAAKAIAGAIKAHLSKGEY